MPVENKSNYTVLAIVAVVAIVVIAYFMQPKETASSKVANAVEDMGDNIEDAGREMDPNRTTSEKIGDAIEDTGDGIRDATTN